MYLSFKDICMCILKSLVYTLIIMSLVGLNILNYKLGVGYCELLIYLMI